ncbi:hypothetical protein BD310DRAFT_1042154 [Dichomitus squalens]|uniref:Uncharacterized protein n=1 Tax=Dichomitus squalens TaxID=114155 RepID=A0A4V2K6W9_9APHY|nr:hypothetical protein BD310DRAFT_1042154 [Dichomitus squalens]
MPQLMVHIFRFVAEHPSFDTISSIARMGHEYQIYNAVKYALTYLRCYYPSDYAGWKQNKRGAPNFRPAHSIGVMNLARLTQTSDIMPAAFWICCNLDIDHLQAGFKRNDGTVETLSRTDLVNVLIARQELAELAAFSYLYVLKAIADGGSCSCDSDDQSDDCQSSISGVLGQLTTSDTTCYNGPGLTGCWPPIDGSGVVGGYEGFGGQSQPTPTPIPVAKQGLKERQEEKREETWDRLLDLIAPA